MRRAVLGWCAAALALGLLASDKPVFQGKVENWYEDLVDEVTFVQTGPWGGAYDAVVVEPMDLSKTEIGGEKKARAAAEEAAGLMDQWAQAAVRAGYTEGAPKVVTAAEADAMAGARVVVLKWRCDSIDPGSRAKRFWLSFGAGHGGITISGALVDRATGKELVTFTHTRLSGRGLAPTGGRYASVLEEAGTESSRDVGKMMAILLRTRP